MGHRRTVSLSALMTLKPPLLHEFLGFGTNHPVVTVGKLTLLCVINSPPLGADVDAAADTHLGATVLLLLCGSLVPFMRAVRHVRGRASSCSSLRHRSRSFCCHGHEVGFAHSSSES